MNNTNIFLEFKKICRHSPDKICIIYKKQESYEVLTYADIYQKASVLREILLKAGIKSGVRAAILLSNGPLWPAAFFGLMSVQAVAVPLDVQGNPEETRRILAHSEAKFLLTEEKFGVSLDAMLSDVDSVKPLLLDRLDGSAKSAAENQKDALTYGPHKLAALFYTSGTTQEHKAVMLTHENLLANCASIKKVNILTKNDILMSLLPLHHVYPFMITCLAPLLEGASVCYVAAVAHQELFEALKKNKVTIFVGVPQLYSLLERSISNRFKKFGTAAQWTANRLMDACGVFSSLSGINVSRSVLRGLHAAFGEHLKTMTSGGAKLDPSVARNFHRWGFDILEGYGLSETSPVVTFTPRRSTKFESVGKPLPDVEIKIVRPDEDGRGEIAVRGKNVMLGYYRAPRLTQEVLRDGWFLTGDLGYQDREGYLFLTGRIKEIIVLPSGKKVNPDNIESHYLRSPFIKEMCVLYSTAGAEAEHLTAVIAPDEEYLKTKGYINIHFKIKWELDTYSQKLPPYQRIKGFVLTREALPRTRLGKLIRYKIEERYASGAYKQPEKKISEDSEKLSRFEEVALNYFKKIFKKDVGLNDHLELDLGLDSLGRIELLAALQDVVNVGIDDSLALELFQARTVKDLITKARQALPESAFADFFKREDLVFWPHILAELPTQENRRRLKLDFNFFDALISVLEIAFFKLLFKCLFFINVRNEERIPRSGPFVITANHVSFLDAFYIVCALPFRLVMRTYFVGFGDIFRHPLLAWAARFHRLIPIDANLNLAETLRICQYILRKGKILVFFPEGQRSIDGKLKEFRKGIGILLKESGMKVLPTYLAGAYDAWPRTRAFPLPAKVSVAIGSCLDVESINITQTDEPYQGLANALRQKTQELMAKEE